MIRDQPLMVTSQSIEDPIRCGYVWVIVRTVNGLRCLLVLTSPRFPVELAVVIVWGHLVGLIVEKALADSEGVQTLLRLQYSPKDVVYELLDLDQFILVRLDELFHHRGKPGSGAAFVAQTSDPGSAILQDHLIDFTVVGDRRRCTVERIVSVREPLSCSEKSSHVSDGLCRGLDHEVLNHLLRPVGVGDRQT